LVLVRSSDLYTVDPTNGAFTRLTYDSTLAKADPSWSPDGNYLVYCKVDTVFGGYGLYRIRADGTADSLLLKTMDPYSLMSPTWAAAGEAITYEAQSPEHTLYRLDLASGSVSPVTSVGYDRWPAASYTGDTVAFTRAVFDTVKMHNIQELNLVIGGGGPVVAITGFDGSMYASWPTWAGRP